MSFGSSSEREVSNEALQGYLCVDEDGRVAVETAYSQAYGFNVGDFAGDVPDTVPIFNIQKKS